MLTPKPTEYEDARMQTAKQDVEQLLKNLPDDSTYEDIQYHLYVLEKIKRGEARARTEGTLTQEQAEARLSKWLTK
ncbi:hypothetical protein [Alkalilimnicola ehrlichii]|nr:hypothetical protein [Alkalilimnicola ehrlichii]